MNPSVQSDPQRNLQNLGRLIKKLQHRHHRQLDQQLRSIGSSLAQWDALRAIDRNPEASLHQLAQLTFQTDQAFGELASKLLKRGLVSRSSGPGRAIKHRLTETGEAVLRQGHPLANAVLEASFAPLSEEERQTLEALLSRLDAE